jgi:hypothetical protein
MVEMNEDAPLGIPKSRGFVLCTTSNVVARGYNGNVPVEHAFCAK